MLNVPGSELCLHFQDFFDVSMSIYCVWHYLTFWAEISLTFSKFASCDAQREFKL